ncbi:hypothetical protein KPH14_003016 [Odynerus spinipes]|uniref:Odorant receptor n=1 Tax=Odynerus spinipes TaxID=1348599 RepID=A0AAD9RWX9_9HYME|nr:hypothetical protein KPH14_003016 [Odynerus spinipes]
MDLFDNPYYALNKRLLIMIGEWPGLPWNKRRFRVWFINIVMYSFSVVEISLIFTSHGEFKTILDLIAPLVALLVCFIKYYTVHFNIKNIRYFLNHIIDNWKLWKSKEELDIMHDFAKEGKMFVFWYTVYIYSCMTTFLVLPFIPIVLDQIVPLNESRPLKPIFRGEYFVDEEEHFLSIYIHMCIVIVTAISTLIATDTFFLLLNCHICGLFAALGHYLENAWNEQPDSKSSSDYLSRTRCLKSVVYSVKVHKKALEFAEHIETFYSIPLLQQAGLCLICMSISLYQILMTLDKPSEAIRYIAFAGAQLVHLFCMCYPGQRMIDYSTHIQLKAYNGLWYKAPASVSKLVLLIIRRSLEPTYLTAGKTFLFCLETYSTILQTSTSYFMVLASFN